MTKQEGDNVSIREVYNLVDTKFNMLEAKVENLATLRLSPLERAVANIEGRLIVFGVLIPASITIFGIILNLFLKAGK